MNRLLVFTSLKLRLLEHIPFLTPLGSVTWTYPNLQSSPSHITILNIIFSLLICFFIHLILISFAHSTTMKQYVAFITFSFHTLLLFILVLHYFPNSLLWVILPTINRYTSPDIILLFNSSFPSIIVFILILMHAQPLSKCVEVAVKKVSKKLHFLLNT